LVLGRSRETSTASTASRRRAEEELGRYSEEVWVAADLAADGDGIAGSVFGRIS
jgi:hypothetical protein